MSQKTIGILGIIFVFLLGIVFYPEIMNRFFPNINKSTRPSYLAFKTDSINKISIKNSLTEAVLEKQGNNWSVNKLPVDKEKMSNLLEALKNLKVSSLASKNKENFSSYEVDEKQNFILTISGEAKDYKLIIGKSGPTASTFYGKGESEEIVYLFEGSLRSQLDAAQNYWVDKTILSLEKDKIAKIEVGAPYQFILKKESDKWQVFFQNKTYDLKEEEASSIMTTFAPLEAYDLATSADSETFDKEKNKTTIDILDNDNINLALLTLVIKDEDCLLKAKDKDLLYKVYKYKFDELLNLKDKVK